MKVLKYVFVLFLFIGLQFGYASNSLGTNNDQCLLEGVSSGKMANGCNFVYWVDYTPGSATWCNGSTWHASLAWPLAVCDVVFPTYSSYAYILPVSYYSYYDYTSTYFSYQFNQCVNSATTYYTVHGTDAYGQTWMTAVESCYTRYVVA